jgi:hypothetical protein
LSDVSEKHVTIFRAEEQAKAESSMKQAASKAWFILVFYLTYSSALKMEAVCSSVTSDDFQQTAQCYITDNSALHNQCCQNIKSYTLQDDEISVKTSGD